MAGHIQEISNIKFIDIILPKTIRYFESITGTDTMSGTK